MPIVTAANLRKELAGSLLFEGVSFSVERRDRLALSGPNGAGKTTLLRMLVGESETHGGELSFAKGTRIALHDQRPPLDRGLTLREYSLTGARDLIETEEELGRLEQAMATGDHEEATRGWPGDAIHANVRQVLADGVVTELERANLLAVLTEMANCDFAATGSAQAEPMQLPIDDSAVVEMQQAVLVHTGEFAYGTRARCERLSSDMGALPVDSVTGKTDVLVIGTRVSRAWLNESYGRKILKAMELRKVGHRVRIISERWWFEHARRAGRVS